MHQRCVRCEAETPTGVQKATNPRESEGGNRHRRSRRRGAATANEWRGGGPGARGGAGRPAPRAVVRSTLPEAATALSAVMRTRLHRAVRSEVRSCSAGARARAATPVRRVVHGAVQRPERGEAGAGRDGPANDAVERGAERVGPAAAVSGASRRANGVRSDRRERRRQGLQWKSERSGDWNGKPGREAGRPNPSHRDRHDRQASAPASPPSWSPSACAPSASGSTSASSASSPSGSSPPASSPSPSPVSPTLSPPAGGHPGDCRRAMRGGGAEHCRVGASSGARARAEEERRSRRGARRRRRRARRRRAVRWCMAPNVEMKTRATPPPERRGPRRSAVRPALRGCRASRPCRRGCR